MTDPNYYILKPNFRLRGWKEDPYGVTDTETGRTIFISEMEMDALQLCNGMINIKLPFISPRTRQLIRLIEERGIVEGCEKGTPLREDQKYRMCPSQYIMTAHWSVTGRCNYRCKHCYMSAPDAKLGELDHDTVMNMIDQFDECGIANVSLTGGEALVRKDFMEIIDALISKRINITTIYSNGALVTDKLLQALDQRGIHPEFNMSFDGVGFHDWLRGIPGAEKIAEEAFKRCQRYGFPTGAEMCIHQMNKHTLRETVKKLASWGCYALKTNPVADVGEWKENGYGESISPDELYQLYLDYIPQYYEDGAPLSLQLGGFFYASRKAPAYYEVPSSKKGCDPEKSCVCGHARMVMYISPEGRALPCMSLSGMDIQEEFPLIPEMGLANCLSDSRYMQLITTKVSTYFEQNPRCKSCSYALDCMGGCRAGALSTDPLNIMGPDMMCCRLFRGGWVPKIHKVAQTAIKKYMPEAYEKIMAMMAEQEKAGCTACQNKEAV